MRIIAISDTHGRTQKAADLIAKLGHFDKLIHLGDGARDLADIQSLATADIVRVKGNNDLISLPYTTVLEIGNTKMLCCHGHTFNVKETLSLLAQEAKACGCQLALYGHTHLLADDTIDGVRLINPGSVGFPFNDFGYVEMTYDGNELLTKIIVVN